MRDDKIFSLLADAGSEATPIIGQTETDEIGKPVKTTQKTLKVRFYCRI